MALNVLDGFDVLVKAFTGQSAITSPIAAGALLDRGWSPGQLYIAVAVALVLAAIVVLAMRLRSGSTSDAVDEVRAVPVQ